MTEIKKNIIRNFRHFFLLESMSVSFLLFRKSKSRSKKVPLKRVVQKGPFTVSYFFPKTTYCISSDFMTMIGKLK